MQCNSASKFLIDQITDGQLLWAPLEKNYDTVMLGYPDNLRSFPMVAGKKEFKEAMLEKFPDEAKAINKYLEMLAVSNVKNLVGGGGLHCTRYSHTLVHHWSL